MEENNLTRIVVRLPEIFGSQRVLDELMGDGPGDAERLWARPLGGDLFELRSIPAVAHGLSYMDVVRGSPGEDGRVYVDHLERTAGHCTIHLIFSPQSSPEAVAATLDTLSDLGGGFEHAYGPYYSVDVPPDAGLEGLMGFLDRERAARRLAFTVAAGGAAPERPSNGEVKAAEADPDPRGTWDTDPRRTGNFHARAIRRDEADSLVYVNLDEADMPGSWEEIPSRHIADQQYEICCVPFFAYDLALGDRVIAGQSAGGDRVVQGRVTRSGRFTIRVAFEPGTVESRGDEVGDLLLWIRSLGCEFEWRTNEYVAMDVPDEKATNVIASRLDSHMESGLLTYDVGQDR